MKTFSLNIRGIGDRAKRRRLRSLLFQGKVKCCFLQETKCSNITRNVVHSLWGGVLVILHSKMLRDCLVE